MNMPATGNGDGCARMEAYLPGLALALAIGLLIGIERGWRMRDDKPGSRVAGIRTFTLLGLIGGLAGLQLGQPLQILTLVLAAGAVAAVIVGYYLDAQHDGNVSATSAIAGLITITLGATAASGQMALAAVGAGATVILLAAREPMHRALEETSAPTTAVSSAPFCPPNNRTST